MAKAKERPNLASLLNRPEETTNPTPVPTQPKSGPRPSSTGQKSGRDGQTSIQGWYPNAVKYTLEELRLKRSKELGRKVTSQELMGEAFNELFKKYGFPETAPMKD
jgi:hypothetical protein